MNLNFKKSYFQVLLLGAAICALSVSSLRAQDVPCPFADDDVILCASPSTFAQVDSVKDVWNLDETQNLFNKLFEKADKELAKAIEKDPSQKERVDFISSLVRNDVGESSVSKAAFFCYFKYVDGVIFAVDIPENAEKPEDVAPGVSMTYVLNSDPSNINVDRFFKEGEDFEIVKKTDKEKLAKIFVKEKGELKATIFFGETKVKDMDKYVVVFAGSQEGAEKKISRFQQTNDFIAKRADGKLFVDHMFKTGLFETVVAKMGEKKDDFDDGAKVAYDMIQKVKSFRFQVNGDAEGICVETTLETVDADSAQTFADLANGGLAALRIKAKAEDNPSDELKFAIEILKKIEVAKGDGSVVVGKAPISAEQMKTDAKYVNEKAK